MTDNQELTFTEQLIIKLRNRDKAIELLTAEVRSLRLRIDTRPESVPAETIANYIEQIAVLQKQYGQVVALTSEERKEIKKDIYVARLIEQMKGIEEKNKRLTRDNNSLINKFYSQTPNNQCTIS